MSAHRILRYFCDCAKLTYIYACFIHIAQRITIIVYPSHQPTHSDPHFTSPETRINTGKNKFQKIYRLLLTFTPAAAAVIKAFFEDTNTCQDDFDAIYTGDLGQVGTELLYKLLINEGIGIEAKHKDCGLMIFDRSKQDVHSGGSGCGCSASVLAGHILPNMKKGKEKNILFCATGALLSPTSSLRGQSVISVAHLVNIKV